MPPPTAHAFEGPIIPNRWHRWGVIWSIYTLIALFFVGQNALRQLMQSNPMTWQVVANEFAYWYVWVILTPGILTYARRFRIARQHWWKGVLAHLALCIVVAPLQELLWFVFRYTVTQPQSWDAIVEQWPRIRGWILVGSLTSFYKYWLIIGIYYLFDYYRKYQLREQEASALQLKTSQLEQQLTQAQLDALKMQLHPHFLFNTLNAIGVLMNEDVGKANRMLVRLSDLLRMTLDSRGAQSIPLHQEVDFLKRYLEIESIRFEDRLQVQWDVSPDVLAVLVPNLILQPIVENAIQHGIAPLADAGKLFIRAYLQNGQLVIEIEDDGPGIDPEAVRTSTGIGLANVEARLEQHYGTAYDLQFSTQKPRGTVVQFVLPSATQ